MGGFKKMNQEIKIIFSDFVSGKLKDISIAIGISEEDIVKNAVFQYVLQF